ncbi:hypothetical protein SORBI_3001G424650 [Sorghum bicolor]|uniref:Uncharacterized protein n=1 Tax=Sorghum bicolor TaxID=4558 RepID=A0A1Z5SAH6_SORBI|nr:hypothetical protein SORBI_3001G424650 [Sorghum bicolor]
MLDCQMGLVRRNAGQSYMSYSPTKSKVKVSSIGAQILGGVIKVSSAASACMAAKTSLRFTIRRYDASRDFRTPLTCEGKMQCRHTRTPHRMPV